MKMEDPILNSFMERKIKKGTLSGMKTKMNNAIGWLGNNLLAFCGLPAVVDVVYKGSADGYSTVFILMWLSGEILALVYVLNRDKGQLPTLYNYVINIILISIIVYYKL